jgi:hypothetical protein
LKVVANSSCKCETFSSSKDAALKAIMSVKVVDIHLLKMLRQAQHEILCGLHPELVEGFALIFLCPQPYLGKYSYKIGADVFCIYSSSSLYLRQRQN